MHNLLPQRAIGSIRRQQTIYSIMALFFVLVLVLSSISHSPAAAQSATPVISLSASCTPDAQGSFTITNIGSSMVTPGSYTLLLNGTPVATNSFQLNAGASTQIHTSGLFGTLELDVSGGGGAPGGQQGLRARAQPRGGPGRRAPLPGRRRVGGGGGPCSLS